MSEQTTFEVTPELVVEGLRKVTALSQNDLTVALDKLTVPQAEKENAKARLEGLLNGDEELLSELNRALSPEMRGEPALRTVKGGVTKYEVLKQWGIPYGEKLYVNHTEVALATDIGEFISVITVACGPEAAPLAAGLAITLAALKLLDRGNGIMITRIPFAVGPCIPTPQ